MAYESIGMTTATLQPAQQKSAQSSFKQVPQKHNDSLFESSKESANYQTQYVSKRQVPMKLTGQRGNLIANHKKSQSTGGAMKSYKNAQISNIRVNGK